MLQYGNRNTLSNSSCKSCVVLVFYLVESLGQQNYYLSLILISIPEVILSLRNTNDITSRMHLRLLLGFVLIEPDLSDVKTLDIGILVFWSWCSV